MADRVTWIGDGSNLGFIDACNLGAGVAAGDILVFVNPDAVVRPDAMAALAACLDEASIGLATGLVELDDEPGTVNAAGNPVHYSLLSWAGGWGEPTAEHSQAKDVASVSGALFAVRRTDWERLGGFFGPMFAYGEDAELSLRTWLAGQRVRYVPTAVASHHYEFTRNPGKLGLLERNRWISLLTVYEASTLRRLVPGLSLVEAGIWMTALRQGWVADKAAAVVWCWRNREQIRRRRREVQSARVLPDTALLPVLASRITPSVRSGQHVPRVVNGLLSALRPRASRTRSSERLAAGNRADTPMG